MKIMITNDYNIKVIDLELYESIARNTIVETFYCPAPELY